MKKHIFILSFLFIILFFPSISCANTSDEKQTILIEKLESLLRKINDLRWQLEKNELQKNISASSYLLVDLSNNFAILNKNHRENYPIASLTKLMAAVVTLENIDINSKIVITSRMLEPHGFSPAIHLGKNITAKDLMKATLIQSTNDAAEALTSFLNEGEFLFLMNEKTKELKMHNTSFADAHGLSYENRSSALDIFRLIRYIRENHPELLEITKEQNFQLEGECINKICTFKNLNNFHQLDEFVGGKTGFLPLQANRQDAGQTFAGIFKFKEVSYAIILLNSKDRTRDVQIMTSWLGKRP